MHTVNLTAQDLRRALDLVEKIRDHEVTMDDGFMVASGNFGGIRFHIPIDVALAEGRRQVDEMHKELNRMGIQFVLSHPK